MRGQAEAFRNSYGGRTARRRLAVILCKESLKEVIAGKKMS